MTYWQIAKIILGALNLIIKYGPVIWKEIEKMLQDDDEETPGEVKAERNVKKLQDENVGMTEQPARLINEVSYGIAKTKKNDFDFMDEMEASE